MELSGSVIMGIVVIMAQSPIFHFEQFFEWLNFKDLIFMVDFPHEDFRVYGKVYATIVVSHQQS